MTSPRYARLVAEVFKRGERLAPEVVPTRPGHDDEITLIEQAMDRKLRQARRFRMVAQWSVAAALAFGGVATWRLAGGRTLAPRATTSAGEASAEGVAPPPVAIAIASGGGAIVASPGSSSPAVAGRPLQAGSRLIVDPGAGVTLSLSTGTHLEVEPGSQLTVVEDGRAQIFALNTGSLHADVAKLGRGERFLVRTNDAEIEVHGTSFLVDVVPPDPACGGGTTTRVTVYEGVVAVRSQGSEDSLRAGERWPRGCRKPPVAPVAMIPLASRRPAKAEAAPIVNTQSVAAPRPTVPEAPSLPVAVAAPAAATPARVATASPRPVSTSGLAEENDLFAEGMLARRYGNIALAIEKMDRFLERFPASHLAENAAAERMRLLRAFDLMKAVNAARQYLQRYPNGFARADAESILAGMR